MAAVGVPVHSYLRIVPTSRETLRVDDAAALTRWRRQHADAFLSRFDATIERTVTWLTEVVERDPARLILIVEDRAGAGYGTLGITNVDFDEGRFELDGVMRGEPAPRPGAMTDAILALLHWTDRVLHLREAHLRVLADNPAVDFYRRVGFEEFGRVGLREVQTDDGIELVADPTATDATLLQMRRATDAGGSGAAPPPGRES